MVGEVNSITIAPVKGWDISGSEWTVPIVLEAGKMVKPIDQRTFAKGQIVMARLLDQNIFNMTGLPTKG